MVVDAPATADDTALEAALAPLLAALPAALAALLAALPAALAPLLTALLAALAADEPMLEALEAISLVASVAWEQLTAKAAATASPPMVADARVSGVFMFWFSLMSGTPDRP